jgi:hypothetical protein
MIVRIGYALLTASVALNGFLLIKAIILVTEIGYQP